MSEPNWGAMSVAAAGMAAAVYVWEKSPPLEVEDLRAITWAGLALAGGSALTMLACASGLLNGQQCGFLRGFQAM